MGFGGLRQRYRCWRRQLRPWPKPRGESWAGHRTLEGGRMAGRTASLVRGGGGGAPESCLTRTWDPRSGRRPSPGLPAAPHKAMSTSQGHLDLHPGDAQVRGPAVGPRLEGQPIRSGPAVAPLPVPGPLPCCGSMSVPGADPISGIPDVWPSHSARSLAGTLGKFGLQVGHLLKPCPSARLFQRGAVPWQPPPCSSHAHTKRSGFFFLCWILVSPPSPLG